MDRKKGQIVSIDLVIGAAIALLLFFTIVFLWNIYSERIHNTIEVQEMILKAYHITDIMSETRGKPTAWERDAASLEVVGLSDRKNILDKDKVSNFTALDYDTVRQDHFSLGQYDFNFSIKRLNGTVIANIGSGSGDIDTRINVRRLVIYDDDFAWLNFALYDIE